MLSVPYFHVAKEARLSRIFSFLNLATQHYLTTNWDRVGQPCQMS